MLFTQNEAGEPEQILILELQNFETQAAEALENGEQELECKIIFHKTAENEKLEEEYFGVKKIETKKGKLIYSNGKIKIKAGTKTIFET